MNRRSFLQGLMASAAVLPAADAAVISFKNVPLVFDGGYPELAAITRKAFVPRIVMQTYMRQPPLEALLHEHGRP